MKIFGIKFHLYFPLVNHSPFHYQMHTVWATRTAHTYTMELARPEHWVGSHSLLQGIFPSPASSPGLPHCRRILYQLSRQGSPRILEWVAYPFSRGSSWPRNWNGVSCIAGGFLPAELLGKSQTHTSYIQTSTLVWLEWVNLTQMTIKSTTVGRNPLEEMGYPS